MLRPQLGLCLRSLSSRSSTNFFAFNSCSTRSCTSISIGGSGSRSSSSTSNNAHHHSLQHRTLSPFRHRNVVVPLNQTQLFSTTKAAPRTIDPSCRMETGNSGPWGAWQARPSAFTQLVVDSMRKLYPEELADRSWDNVGLLLGNEESTAAEPKVMVTNDLTFQVAAEAIAQGVSVIVSYHPFIFSGLKSITHKDPQQATLLRLARAGIAVYSPHTAVDAAPSGLNSWLAEIIEGPHGSTRSVAVPCAQAPESHAPAGYGAIGRFDEPVALTDILGRLASGLGGLRHVMVAQPTGADVYSTMVHSYAVCAGSGYSVLKDVDTDILIMGETSHHSALRAVQQGKTLVQVFHSNSERAYLHQVLRPRLEELLRKPVPEAQVVLSEYDRDPFRIFDIAELTERK